MYNYAYCYGVRNTFQTAGSSMRLVRSSFKQNNKDTEKKVMYSQQVSHTLEIQNAG